MAANLQEQARQDQDKTNMGLYKDTLMNQMRINDQNRKNFGKMTFVEKKLNRNDLQRYKKKEADTVTALIPGINNINGVGGSQPL